MWSLLIIGDISRHNADYVGIINSNDWISEACSNAITSARTTGSQEQRFTVLKHVVMQD